MLSPEYLQGCTDSIISLYQQLEDATINDIVRRLVNTNFQMTQSAVFQNEKLQQAGMVFDDVIKQVGVITGKSDAELKTLFLDAGTETLAFDDSVYKSAGLKPLPIKQSPQMLGMLTAGIKKCGKEMKNLTKTTANTAQTAYLNACDMAYMQISSGAFDYNTAVRLAIQRVGGDGSYVLYPSGHRDRIDVAIRRSALTGVNQTCGELQTMRMDEMDCELVETTAHAGARFEHALWQGRVFSYNGRNKKYPDFRSSTGYGTVTGLMGANCRHGFFPFYAGISDRAYTQRELDQMESHTVEYNGKKIKDYDASQIQRKMERDIRDTKRTLTGIDAAIKETKDESLKRSLQDDFAIHSAKLKMKEAKLSDFLNQTARENERARVQVSGFGRSQAQKAVHAFERQKLPGYKKAVIPDDKIVGYALNKNHPTGKNKAVAFEKALGYNLENKDILIQRIHDGLKNNIANSRTVTAYGKPFEVTMKIQGVNGKSANVKTGWIIDNGNDAPRLTSVYVTGKGKKK